MVHLYYWNSIPNVGDYFSYWLLKKLYKNINFSSNPNLIATGSILGFKAVTENTIVWGSGWHNSKWSTNCKIKNKNNFKAVRGKLTANFLNLNNDVVLGDPGLLASKYFDSTNIKKKRRIVILSHWQDYKDLYSKYHDKYEVVNMQTNDVEYILTKICESELVLSSSLHGIIFAHSFGIPAVHIELNDIGSIDNFKFKDYYSVLDINYIKYDARKESNFSIIYQNKNRYVPSKECVLSIQNKLLSVLPKEESLPDETICICAIAKNENNYIREWVEHHKKLGFNKIFLYDNNDIDGERFEEVIGDYIKEGYVEVLNVRGLSNQQIKCYNDFYHSTNCNKFKWVAYFDIDEFLFLDNNKSVQEWLNDVKYVNFDGIAVNWKYFDDNNLCEVKDGNYSIKRFTHEFNEKDSTWSQSRFSKRFMRTGKQLVVNSSHGPITKAQMSEYSNGVQNKLNVCNIEGEYIPGNNLVFSNWTHKGGYLAHYRFKTIEEYLTNKMKRGYPTLYKNSGKDLNLKDFFNLNDVTEEKLEVAARILNTTKEELMLRYNLKIGSVQKQESEEVRVVSPSSSIKEEGEENNFIQSWENKLNRKETKEFSNSFRSQNIDDNDLSENGLPNLNSISWYKGK